MNQKQFPEKISLSKGFRSWYSCPTPINRIGVEVTFTIDKAAPPFASASLLVKIEASNFTCL